MIRARRPLIASRPGQQFLVLFLAGMLFIGAPCHAKLSFSGQKALEKARLAAENQRWKEVPALLAPVLQEDPQDVGAQALLGMADLANGNVPWATQRLTWVCAQRPQEASYRLALAKALWASCKQEEARAEASLAARLNPHDPHIQTFLRRVVPVASTASGSLFPPAAPPPVATFSEEEKREESPAPPRELPSAQRSAWTGILREVEERLARDPEKEMEILARAVLETPDLMAQSEWEGFLARTVNPRIQPRDELARRFLRWKTGVMDGQVFARWLASAPLTLAAWKNDALLAALVPLLQAGGIDPLARFSSIPPLESEDWVDALPEDARDVFLNGQYQEAWMLFEASKHPDTPEMHYVAARLTLELWQIEGNEQDWLGMARGHLLKYQGAHRWSDDSRIILAEIEARSRDGRQP